MTTVEARRRPASAVAAALATVVVAGVALSLTVGSRGIPLDEVWAALTTVEAANPDQAVVSARVARTLVGLLAGGALGLAGATMQGLTRNPLADPGLLGVNAGAALAMVLAISVFGVTALGGYLWFAFVGAAIAAVVVHAVAGLGHGGATPVKLAVAGAALTAGLSSWTTALLLTDRQTLDTFRFWQVGTVGGRALEVVWPVLPFLVVGAVLGLVGGRLLNVLALGDDLARGLGRRAGADRVVAGLAIVLLCGGATALAGPVVFVGLLAPHLARMLVGADYGRILPTSLALGAALVVLADTAGRVVLPPTEVQVGIMTAVVGVPLFLALVRRGRMGAL